MKKLMMIAVASLGVFAMSCDSDNEKVVKESALPNAAKEFITQHFADQSVTRVVKDTEGNTEYDVRLDNAFKLEFNGSGEWRDVDGYGVEIPQSIIDELPAGIVSYIESNHEAQPISKVEFNRSRSRYEVELTGGRDIVFNL